MERSIVIYFCLNGKTKCILPNILQRVKIKHLREGEILSSDLFIFSDNILGCQNYIRKHAALLLHVMLMLKQNRQLKESLISSSQHSARVTKGFATIPPAANGKPIFFWDAGALNCMIMNTKQGSPWKTFS